MCLLCCLYFCCSLLEVAAKEASRTEPQPQEIRINVTKRCKDCSKVVKRAIHSRQRANGDVQMLDPDWDKVTNHVCKPTVTRQPMAKKKNDGLPSYAEVTSTGYERESASAPPMGGDTKQPVVPSSGKVTETPTAPPPDENQNNVAEEYRTKI